MPSRKSHQILLTAFDPFGGHATNSSAAVVEALAVDEAWRDRLIARVLPTVYAESGRIVRELIAAHRPDAVLCLGLSAHSSAIQLERFALNLNEDPCGDNAGDCASGRFIVPEGPIGYGSTLPLAAMFSALRDKDVPVAWSNSAGTFVCNHVFYTARHAMTGAGDGGRACGFVHLPPTDDGGLPLATLVDAVATCLKVIDLNLMK